MRQTETKQGEKMRVFLFLLIIGGWFVFMSPVTAQDKAEKGTKERVQIAILLDTSGSMEGLIEQAKSQLWKIVNEMALAKKNGVNPQLEVALYEYGKDSIPASEGYLRMIVPLSTDLDKISEELFKLTTNGGSEYCGQVIQRAAQGLQWAKSNEQLKVIFIAGNEPFTQGDVDYKKSCKEAISKGIIVNTIFCGSLQEGIDTNWKDGADLADGKYMNIDHNQAAVHIEAPQDKEIMALGQKLNETYVAYGTKGAMSKSRQEAQDANATSVAGSGAMVQRSVAKASTQYSNSTWDIVDAEKEGKVKVEELDEDSLPAEMKKMSPKERKDFIEKKKKERAQIQEKINTLRQQRDKYVAEKQKSAAQKQTLDNAVITTIKDQAKKKNYKFEEK